MTNQGYRTKDLYEAAFLYTKGCKLIALDRQGWRAQFWFVFENRKEQECERLANAYWSGDAEVKAVVFVDSIRKLKDRIFSQKDYIEAGVVRQQEGGGG